MGPNFTVTGQQEVLDLGDTGMPTRMWEISFTTIPHGVKGSVRIPKADLTPQNAERAIEKHAEELEAIASLGAPNGG